MNQTICSEYLSHNFAYIFNSTEAFSKELYLENIKKATTSCIQMLFMLMPSYLNTL